MDGIVFKVRDNGKIINKTVYLCVGLKQYGLKEVLGMWVGKTECLFLKKVDSIFTLKINNSISVRNPLTLLPA